MPKYRVTMYKVVRDMIEATVEVEAEGEAEAMALARAMDDEDQPLAWGYHSTLDATMAEVGSVEEVKEVEEAKPDPQTRLAEALRNLLNDIETTELPNVGDLGGTLGAISDANALLRELGHEPVEVTVRLPGERIRIEPVPTGVSPKP